MNSLFNAVAALQVDGANYDIGPLDVIAWLAKMNKKQPLTIVGLSHDTVRARFLSPIEAPDRLAEAMYAFCPDIVDQGVGSVDELAALLRDPDPSLYFWWD